MPNGIEEQLRTIDEQLSFLYSERVIGGLALIDPKYRAIASEYRAETGKVQYTFPSAELREWLIQKRAKLTAKPAELPTLPAFPEPYTGYRAEVERTSRAASATERQISTLISQQHFLTGLYEKGTPMTQSVLESEMRRAASQISNLTASLQKQVWRATVLQDPTIAGKTVADVAARYKEYPLDEGDKAWLTAHLQGLTVPAAAPAATPEALREAGARLLERPRPAPVSLAALSVEEIVKALATPVRPEIGVDNTELRNILIAGGIETADADKILSLEEHQKGLIESWKKTNADIVAFREGTKQMADLKTPWYSWALQGLAGAPPMKAMEKYLDVWDYPRSGWLVQQYINLSGKPAIRSLLRVAAPAALAAYTAAAVYVPPLWYGYPAALYLGLTPIAMSESRVEEFEKAFQKAREPGANTWEAFGVAWQDINANGFLKFLAEVATDPVTLVGFGIYTRIAKPIPLLGKAVKGFESGYVKLWDTLIFDQLKAIGRAMPKTAAMKATEYMTDIVNESRRVIVARTGLEPAKITPEATEALYRAGLDSYFTHGNLQGGCFDLGRMAVDSVAERVISKEVIVSWARVLRSPIVSRVKDVTTAMATHIDTVMDMTLRNTRQAGETADILLTILSAPKTAAAQATAKSIVEDFMKTVGRAAERLISQQAGDRSGFNIVMRVAGAAQRAYIAEAESLVQLERFKAGMAAQMLNKIDPVLRLIWIDILERGIIMPVARGYLAFGFYGVGNIFEGIFKPVFARTPVTPWMPRWLTRWIGGSMLDTKDLFTMMNKGLVSVPEIEQFIARPEVYVPLTQARWRVMQIANDLMTGRIGRLPGIEQIPGLRNIDFQRWLVESSGYIGTVQRTDYLSKMFVRKLGEEVDPELVRTLLSIADRHLQVIPKTGCATTDKLFQQYIKYAVLTDTDEVRNMFRAIFNTRDAREVEKIAAVLKRIDPELKESIINGANTGELWDDAGRAIDAWMETAQAVTVNRYLKSPEFLAEEYTRIGRAISEYLPKNYNDLAGEAQMIENLIDTYRANVRSNLKIAQYEARFLRGKAKTELWDETWDSLGRFIETADEQGNSSVGKLIRDIEQLRYMRIVAEPTKVGYRTGRLTPTTGLTATEGEGLYVAKTRELADVFVTRRVAGRGAPREVTYAPPRQVLDGSQNQFVLNESADIFNPILEADSEWVKIQKQAAQNVGITDATWGRRVPALNKEISRLAKERGYDAIDCGEWIVLLEERLWKPVLPALEAPIPAAKAEQLTAWAAGQERQLAYYRTARVNHMNYRRVRFAEPAPKARGAAWWDETYSTIDGFYTEAHEKYLAQLRNVDIPLAAIVDDLPPKPLINTIGRPLTGADLAQLYGGSVDDLVQSWVRVDLNALRDKDEFIAHVIGEADRMAKAAGKTAEELGWTDARVGELFEQLGRRAGFEPGASPIEPAFRELEELRQGLWKIYQTKGLIEAKHRGLEDWLDGLVYELGRVEGYARPVARPLPPAAPAPVRAVTDPEWVAKRQRAMDLASQEYYRDWADYMHPSAVNATLKSIFPFWCVPEDVKILTRAGWKHYSQLIIGEDVLTVNPDTLMTEWQPVQDIAVFDYNDELMVIPAKGKDIKFTPNHRWLVVDSLTGNHAKIRRGYELTEGYDCIPRALPHTFPEESILSPRDAAILGWTVTDGYVRTCSGRKPLITIYQSAHKYLLDVEELLGTKPWLRDSRDNYVIKARQADSDRILSVCPSKDYLLEIIPQLSKEAAEAMWDAMFKAEGNVFTAYNGNKYYEFIQNPGSVKQGFEMLSILLGRGITSSDSSVYLTNNNHKPYQAKQCRRMFRELYTGKVWCPVTSNGTWWANFNGSILPTGNTYEAHRWAWLPRTALQHPGVLPAWGAYLDKTDRGYFQLPGTMISYNILRGTIAMGGMTRLMLRDFPEFQDLFPEVVEPIDFISRFGFYPNVLIMGAINILGVADRRRGIQVWEMMPPFVKTPLGLFISATDSRAAKALRNNVFPDRYRDYYALLIGMQKMQRQPQLELDPFGIWSKVERGVELTAPEIRFWDSCIKETMRWGALMEQVGLFRLRPEELDEALKQVQLIISEITGVSPEEQLALQRKGLRYNDYIRKYVAPDQQRLLNQLDAFQIWTRRLTPLLPSLEAQKVVLASEFWNEVRRLRDAARTTGVYEYHPETGKPDFSKQLCKGQEQIDTDAIRSGNMSIWRAESSDKDRYIAAAVNSLHNTESYRRVPLTIEERVKEWETQGTLPLAMHPAEELLNLWYEIKVERVEEYSIEEDRAITYDDWDTFWALRAAFMRNMKDYRPDFVAQLTRDMTPLERTYFDVWQERIFPYRNGVRAAIDIGFTSDEKRLLNEFRLASPDRRAQIRELARPDGRKLVASYQDYIRTARRNYRMTDPEVDAWLRFFGYVETCLTPEANAFYSDFRTRWNMPL